MLCVNYHQNKGHPPYIAVTLKKTAYGMNDAPRRWWNILDMHFAVMVWFPRELTDAVMYYSQ